MNMGGTFGRFIGERYNSDIIKKIADGMNAEDSGSGGDVSSVNNCSPPNLSDSMTSGDSDSVRVIDNFVSDSNANMVNRKLHSCDSAILSATQMSQTYLSLSVQANITAETVSKIENDLEFYEKVSLVFLLYNNVDLALQRLQAAEHIRLNGMNPSNLISDWAFSGVKKWQTKLLESLAIIQNYELLVALGYNKADIQVQFFPNNTDAALSVDLTRKGLYKMCEAMDKEKSARFIELVEADPLHHNVKNELYNPAFMEINLLRWISSGYINVIPHELNLKNVTKHLKVMSLDSVVDRLESILSSRKTEEYSNVDQKSSEKNSLVKGKTSIKKKYDIIDANHVGLCIIINQKNFFVDPHKFGAPELESRLGTENDEMNLKDTFGRFNIAVVTLRDLTSSEMCNRISAVVKEKFKQHHSMLIMIILSHGVKDAVYGSDSVPVTITSLQKSASTHECPALVNKPKVLIVQACQGDSRQEVDHTIVADGPMQFSQRTQLFQQRFLSDLNDWLLCTATVPGCKAYRHKINGSLYIQQLCAQLKENGKKKHLYDILDGVNDSFTLFCIKYDNGEHCKMTPMFKSTLRKRLYLTSKV